MPSNAPKGKLHMSLRSKRLVGVAASTVLLSLVSATAHAQTIDVLTGGTNYFIEDAYVITEYTFSSPMILNSIGFLSRNGNVGTFEYSINNVAFSDARTSSIGTFDALDSGGVRWLNLSSPITLNKDSIVRVKTYNTLALDEGQENYITAKTTIREFQTLNLDANVSYNTFDQQGNLWNNNRATNSNLKVSNPSSNVAPEPGSIALLLTGGGALAGIALRRRRNAG
jgi:hypothetical protein